jgi:DNA modification methylase
VHFSPQSIYCGDCLDILSQFPANSVDLIYIDPPFNSNRNYEIFWGDTQEKRAFEDRYGDAMAYISYMRPRVKQLYRVLRSKGSFYYHCDWHASHYVKAMLDEIFGANNFVNEIVWKRTSSHNDSKKWAQIHDTIFFYGKQGFKWNPQFTGHDPVYVEKFYRHHDEKGQYRLDHVIRSSTMGERPNLAYEYKGYTPRWGWRAVLEKIEKLDAEGKLVWSKSGRPYMKRYLAEQKGTPVSSVITDIPPISPQSAERLGYPTQKPLALLERIIKASSNPGDIVLDAFCGCGTALVASQQLGRRWLGIDISPTSCNVMGARLEKNCGLRQAPPTMGADEVAASWNKQVTMEEGAKHKVEDQAFYRFSNLPRSAEQLRLLPPFEFENWAVLQLGEVLRHKGHTVFAQPNRSKVGDLGLDGKIYLIDRASLPRRQGESIFGEKQSYLPVQVKHTQSEKSKIGRPVIDSFAHALERDGRPAGFVIGWEFSKDALVEIERLRKADPQKIVIPVTVQRLIEESFDSELLALMR